ncbi:hypothetical protein [Bacillus wiedmannii]|uniref:hypothetical protein n=1 Tax=Bacillus wiedmannii TaxID=1890302 RepID=UPI0025A0041F|nr:hypothetical protein [Bacillus wiedmannii]MDM5267636.1 hypothetical protein [Bacillus wiedmannii]
MYYRDNYYDRIIHEVEQFSRYTQPTCQNVNNYFSQDNHRQIYPINGCSYYYPYHYPQIYTHPIYNRSVYVNGYQENWKRQSGLDSPEANIFRGVSNYAMMNRFAGGFPTFNKDGEYYEVVLIDPRYGVSDDVRLGDQEHSPADFTVHIRNVDRALRDDIRYLGGISTFHVGASGKLFGATRLFKNAGERRWVSVSDLGFVDTDSNEDRMIKAQNYAIRQGFAGGFPTFEHRSQTFELILLNKDAAKIGYILLPEIQSPIEVPSTTPPELVVLQKTIFSFDYSLFPKKTYRAYLVVQVPQAIAASTQATLDRCMDRAKDVAVGILLPFFTPATMGGLPGAIPGAIAGATKSFLACVASDPAIYPYINSINVSIKSEY